MVDLIVQNFGPLEAILFVELALLATAALFYKAARIASKNSRDDALVRFYYVFWQAFRAGVMPVRVSDGRLAEERARAMGVAGVGEADVPSRIDAPDLAALTSDDLRGRAIETPPPPAPASTARTGKAAGPVAPIADATLDVHVVGRSADEAVAGRRGRTLVLRVKHDVEDGLANGVATTLVAGALGVPAYRVVLLRGQYRADKAFKIVGVEATALDRIIGALRSVDA